MPPGLPADITGSPNGGMRCTPEVLVLKRRLKFLSISFGHIQFVECRPIHPLAKYPYLSDGHPVISVGQNDFRTPFDRCPMTASSTDCVKTQNWKKYLGQHNNISR